MSELARKRWQLLGEVLSSRRYLVNSELVPASVRRFRTFGLLTAEPCLRDELCDDGDDGCNWYVYTCSHFPLFKALVRHVDSHVTLDHLQGFNNTGNVCVWPSEEVLTYYCLRNSGVFSKKAVCELGGGMTCLAAIALATCCDASEIFMTDGNEQSVSNLEHIVSKNQSCFYSSNVHAGLLRWGNDVDLGIHEGHFDYIISADCLFFDEGRADLASMIFRLLKPKGEAVIMAPRRGETFQQFVEIASSMSLCPTVTQIYDEVVWNLHLQNVAKGVDVYDEMLHYPWLLHLTKSVSMS